MNKSCIPTFKAVSTLRTDLKKCTQTQPPSEGSQPIADKVQIKSGKKRPEKQPFRFYTQIYKRFMRTIKTVDAFGKLAGICAGLEGRYTPARPNLLPSALVAQMTGARAAMESVNNAERDFRRAVANRVEVFHQARKAAGRISQWLNGDTETVSLVADIDLPLSKLSGSYRRKAAPTTDGQLAERRVYSAGMDFVNRIGHMEHVLKALEKSPHYLAPAADLTVPALYGILRAMQTVHQEVTDAKLALQEARDHLNTVLHAPGSGLVPTANAVRRNIRSQFELRSPEAKAIKGLLFVNR